jgi:sec-independent protein translocase protein TatA
MGKGMRSLKNATNDIKGEIKRSADNQGIDTDLAKDISQEINKAKEEISDIEGAIRRKL